MGLNALDLVVIAAYLAGVTLFGLRFAGRKRTVREYFLASNTAPWWAISLSIVAAETSTLTIIGIPGLAYDSDFRFLQLVVGYIVGRVVVSFVLIPQYFRGELVTAYQLIERRFGQRLRTLAGGLFLLTRAAAEGVRVFAVAIVIRVALGGTLSGLSEFSRDLVAIAIVTLLTLIYTFHGGMAAVIWTDVVQLGVYLAGTAVALFTIVHLVPGGWPAIQSIGANAHKFRVFDLSWNLSSTYTLWSGVIGGAFLTAASHGTDQLIVQRLLSARSLRQSQLALLSSGVVHLLPVFALPACGSHAVCVLQDLSAGSILLPLGYNLSFIRRWPVAARNERPSHLGNSCRGHVEPERGAQFAILNHGCGFLYAHEAEFI